MSVIDPADVDSEDGEFDDEGTESTGSKRLKKKMKILSQVDQNLLDVPNKEIKTKEEIIEQFPILYSFDDKKEEDTNTETSEGDDKNIGYYNSLKHIYYYYPPPVRVKNKSEELDDHKEPCYGLRTLKSLNVTGCNSLTDKGVKYMTYICQNLEYLNLRGCNKINDNACSILSEFSKLEHLILTGCTRITDSGLESLSKMKSKNLKTLDLTFCHQVTDAGLKHISTIKSLTHLDLTCCRKITPNGLQYLIDHCVNLISLNLTGCDQIFLSTLKMKPKDSKLEKLHLMGCKSTSDECMKKLSSWAPKLNDLNIAYSDHVTDVGIDVIIQHCPCIHTLNIKRCTKITGKEISILNVSQDKSLKLMSEKLNVNYLNITGCKKISNQGIEYISLMKNLKELGLRRLELLTDDGISYLTTLKNLEILDLSECNSITKSSVKELCKGICEQKLTVDLRINSQSVSNSEFLSKFVHSPTKEHLIGLRSLKLEKCLNMTKDFVDQLQHHYKLSVVYCQDNGL
jgi:hypothetical protein